MDDLLVIIFTLIVAVIGALGQIKKKKKPVRTAGKPETDDSDNFWSLVEKQFYDEQPNQEVTEEIESVEELSEVEEKVEEKKPTYRFRPENEGSSEFQKSLLDEIKEEKPVTKKRLKDFSLRKAVIYSEILNRKYH